MDDSAVETKVEWREWGPEAFGRAEGAGKPVLLSLWAPWSEDCREMDRTTYSEPRIAANVNDGFVPVRVNVDRHPRVRDRYNMGGFPSTVFTTPDGTVITGATFLGVDGFREILDAVRRTWDGKGEEAGSIPRQLGDARPPGGELSARVEEHMVEQLLAAYDDEFGGWGTDVKFPLPRTIEFALVRARDQATRTLEAVQNRLFDTYDGGFYRFSHNRNWGSPQREKLVDENAALVRAFAHGYRYTGEDAYRETAERTVEYLTTDLWTGDAFAASQGGDDSYYRLEATERAEADPPAVDQTVFAGHNGVAVDGLLTYAAYTDDERARRYAERARDHVLAELVGEDGAVVHFGDPETGEVGEAGLLSSQARTLAGLTTSASVLGEPGPMRAVADYAIDALRGEDGAFRDGPTEGAGLLDRPLYPLDTNVDAADALIDCWLLTDEDRYREAARDALAAFAGATDRMGVEVAAYASAVARLRDPRVVAVGADPGSDLHRAALRLADHESVVSPADGRAEDGEAVVLADGEREGQATDPEGLESLLTG
ncbi:DUF255 domain-containing protein [Halosimplex aquaticum]|uniref:DUF255 domain-containing protein n=1 Tax=Halosimplex aquaticum TaxID=3026162 RepID=A0ABD5Y0Z4_9EURY|nr:DUF255 domain-containing protein [Halosimplex aquaticum]